MGKRIILAATAAALIAGGLHARSREAGPPDKRQAAPGEFDRIAVDGTFQVTVRAGKTTSVSLAGPRTMLDDTELLVRDGQLLIRWQEGASWSRNGKHGVDIEITVPTLRGAIMGGAGSIAIDRVDADTFSAMVASSGGITVGSLTVERLQAVSNGAGTLALGRIEAKTIDFVLGGSGGVRAEGRAGSVKLVLAGSGSFDGQALAANDAVIVSAGSGALRAAVTNSANIRSSGSGDVDLIGGAKCTVSKEGSGKVRCS